MNVLLVEDDAYKRDKIEAVLATARGFTDVSSVTRAASVFQAARELRAQRFDVMILDITLPITDDGDPQQLGGVELLEDIVRHPAEYGPPSHTIGITAYADVHERCGRQFASWMLSIALYDPSTVEWENALRARIEHILSAEAATAVYQSELAVICALESELAAVLALDWQWRQTSKPGDHSIYYEGHFLVPGGRQRVIAAAAARKGMPAATTLATKLIASFRPRHIAMVGIAAGVRGKVKVGDVVCANPCWDWGSGKYENDGAEGEGRFAVAPYQAHLDVGLREHIQSIAGDQALLDHIKRAWPGMKPDHTLSAKVGPLATGGSVLADAKMMEFIREQHKDILAVEMEGYGVFVAAEESAAPRPKPFVLKSVVDYGDASKGDGFQACGAYTSASFLVEVAQKGF